MVGLIIKKNNLETKYSKKPQIRTDTICRNKKIALFSSFLFGYHGIVYMDHNEHQFKYEF